MISKDNAIRAIATAMLNGLNGAELSMWLRALELLAVVMPTAPERNAMRESARELCGAFHRPAPPWAQQREL